VSQLVWTPAWHRQGESFWSAINKIAFSSGASVWLVLSLIAGVHRTRARAALLVPDAKLATVVCSALSLGYSCASQLFAGLSPMSFSARQYLQVGIRWCPECLKVGYHSTVFQDWRLQR
jgi:hypothetical protein